MFATTLWTTMIVVPLCYVKSGRAAVGSPICQSTAVPDRGGGPRRGASVQFDFNPINRL